MNKKRNRNRNRNVSVNERVDCFLVLWFSKFRHVQIIMHSGHKRRLFITPDHRPHRKQKQKKIINKVYKSRRIDSIENKQTNIIIMKMKKEKKNKIGSSPHIHILLFSFFLSLQFLFGWR